MDNLPFPTNILDFITWMGSAAGVAFIQATVLERFPYWGKLPANAKSIIVFLISVSLPGLSAWLLGVAKPADLTMVQWILNLALQGLMVWASAQWIHAANPSRVKVEVKETVTETVGTPKTGVVEVKTETTGDVKAMDAHSELAP